MGGAAWKDTRIEGASPYPVSPRIGSWPNIATAPTVRSDARTERELPPMPGMRGSGRARHLVAKGIKQGVGTRPSPRSGNQAPPPPFKA